MEGLPGHPVRRRRPGARGRADPLLSRRVVLLRHGRTRHNATSRIQGQLDTPLDDVGQAQAEALGTVFAADPPSAIVSSDLRRAADTAAAVGAHVGLSVRLDPRLRETHFGEWQGLDGPEVAQRWPERYAAWRRGEDVPVGGETPAQVAARATACLAEALPDVPDGATLLLVTHGGTARGLLGAVLELPEEHWWRLAPLGNTCWTTLVEADRGWRLERHNTGLGPLLGDPTGATSPDARGL